MKAVIVEIKGRYAAALSDDGSVIRVKNENYAVGKTIEIRAKRTNGFFRKPIAQIAAAAAAFILLSIPAAAYYTPYSYVSLDVNPSIEYSVNLFDKVLTVKAVNTDGEGVIQELKLKNKSIDDALMETLKEIVAKGYLTKDELGGIMIATSCDNDASAEKLAIRLQQKTIKMVNEENVNASVEAVNVAEQRVAEAKQLGVTPGKLNLVEKLKASSQDPESIDTQQWLNAPVKEIMKAIKTNNDKGNETAAESNKKDQSKNDAANKTDSQSNSQSEDKINNQPDINKPENTDEQETDNNSQKGKDNSNAKHTNGKK